MLNLFIHSWTVLSTRHSCWNFASLSHGWNGRRTQPLPLAHMCAVYSGPPLLAFRLLQWPVSYTVITVAICQHHPLHLWVWRSCLRLQVLPLMLVHPLLCPKVGDPAFRKEEIKSICKVICGLIQCLKWTECSDLAPHTQILKEP